MKSQIGIEVDNSILMAFLEESTESLGTLDPLLIRLEKESADQELINSIFRPVHSIKGNAPFFGLMQLKTIAHEFESLLAAIRAKKISISKEILSLLLEGIDEIKAIVSRVSQNEPEVLDDTKFHSLIERAQSAVTGQLLAEIPDVSSQAVKPIPTSAKKESASTKGELGKSMRVSEERIDTFLGFVGELVIAQDMLRHFTSKVVERMDDFGLMSELEDINNVINTLGNGLEKAIMSIRRVPVKTLFQKTPRLIRDVAVLKGKEIQVILEGEEVEIDKSLIEILDAPLIHMARNAADHGVETPQLRKDRGKDPTGKVTISCKEEATDIVVTVRDDGGGLNFEGLKRKAESLGLISPGDELLESQIVDLIFMAGVSTAQEISDVSGRGVGMDVVKRNIETVGGVITVSSEPGKGSAFTIRLPKSVTTQIIQGFVVRTGDVDFVLPLDRVNECFYFEESKLNMLLGSRPCIERHKKILPLLRMNAIFGPSIKSDTLRESVVITFQTKGQEIALLVDEIVGTRQLVLKELDPIVNPEKLFLGGALLGDGAVALIVNVEKVVNVLSEPQSLEFH